ncbi:hypothetical protein [Candidatus Mycoplasma haematominutum]|uniref:Uncharacterized protein n=1 Tax=Candidatus Mycoplasma haematominutum 'Birmingham 1' TaxID=1116213 RepID=G8C3M3_9MOLU|nr:hypothetical protein [Candidatus Mycoplasma haematominutum]CCE66921.1 conserved haemoplasma hypothetical protein [Candidatus Mycoplasma haematominutum 'Birmingham 1']
MIPSGCSTVGMRAIFNWDTFRGYLQEEISDFEYNFLKRVFSQAALSFGGFGAAVCAISAISGVGPFKSVMENSGFKGACLIAALISGAALMLYYLPRYHSNPMDVTPKFVRRAYITLMVTYGTIFIALFKGLELIGVTSGDSGFANVGLGGALFGATLLVYAIPAAIGVLMQRHSTALKLSRFVKNCYLAYLGLFLVGLVVTLATFTLGGSGSSSLSGLWEAKKMLMMLLYGAIVFVSPILSIYRMKMVTRYVDEKDPVAIKKWELFFVFEILVQLMQMAIYIVRMAFSCVTCTARR